MRAFSRAVFRFEGVVLIADIASDEGSSESLHMRRDLEMTDPTTLGEIQAAISQLGLPVYHYTDPKGLADNASRHVSDVVLSIYGGKRSRNRMALVPAICETYGLAFVGPDVYGRIICQDKEVTKHLARQFGLQTPEHRIIRGENDLNVVRTFPVPFVVKPLLEGSSIGISQRNLVRKATDGVEVARELLAVLQQPVLIEEFVAGKEVSYNRIDAHPVDHWSYAEIRVEGEPDYFDHHLFDADEKRNRHLRRHVHTIDDALTSSERANCDALLNAIGHVGYCRVDGKHDRGRFVFLEVTPDAWIAPLGAFAGSFIDKGWAYRDVIAAVLLSAAPILPNR